MRFEPAAQLFASLRNEQSILLLGPPGIGKTALGHAVADLMKTKAEEDEDSSGPPIEPIVECRDLCSHLPEDLLGLPWRDGDKTVYCPPSWLKRLSAPGAVGVLILDDIAAASPAVQTAAFKLVLERRSGDCFISDGVKIICTANRKEDKSGATTLPAAFRNRCLIASLEPDIDEWTKWSYAHNLPGVVPAFLSFKPGYLSMLPGDADKKFGAFATPRTWEMVARNLHASEKCGNVHDMVAGLVGETIGVEFTAFFEIRTKLPSPKAILDNPKGVLPNPPTEPSQIVSIVTAIGELAAKLSKEKNKEARDVPKKLLIAMAHISQSNREFACPGLMIYSTLHGNVTRLLSIARECKNEPGMGDLLKHLRKSLIPND